MLEAVFRRLLNELKDLPILGELPTGDVYFARLFSDSEVGYLPESPSYPNEPIKPRDDKNNPFNLFNAIKSKWVFQIEDANDEKLSAAAQMFVDTGLLDVVEEEAGKYTGEQLAKQNPDRFPGGTPPKTLLRYRSKLYGEGRTTIRIDRREKVIDLNQDYLSWNTRRPGKGNSSKSYVIPSGDVSFEENLLNLQKLVKHVVRKDPKVDETYRIIGSEKFRGETVADLLGRPRETDRALVGAPGLVAYHGTSLSRWEVIKKKGLRPGNAPETYVDLIPGFSDKNVYLTFSHAIAENYATRAALDDTSKAIVLKVIVPDPAKMLVDEDQMGWVKLSRTYTVKRKGLRTSTNVELEEVHPRNFLTNLYKGEYENDDELKALSKEVNAALKGLLKKSLNAGTFAYRGIIMPKFIKPSMIYARKPFKSSENKGGPKDDEYRSIRKSVQAKAKRFDEASFRSFVCRVLAEDITSFEKDTADVRYGNL